MLELDEAPAARQPVALAALKGEGTAGADCARRAPPPPTLPAGGAGGGAGRNRRASGSSSTPSSSLLQLPRRFLFLRCIGLHLVQIYQRCDHDKKENNFDPSNLQLHLHAQTLFGVGKKALWVDILQVVDLSLRQQAAKANFQSPLYRY